MKKDQGADPLEQKKEDPNDLNLKKVRTYEDDLKSATQGRTAKDIEPIVRQQAKKKLNEKKLRKIEEKTRKIEEKRKRKLEKERKKAEKKRKKEEKRKQKELEKQNKRNINKKTDEVVKATKKKTADEVKKLEELEIQHQQRLRDEAIRQAELAKAQNDASIKSDRIEEKNKKLLEEEKERAKREAEEKIKEEEERIKALEEANKRKEEELKKLEEELHQKEEEEAKISKEEIERIKKEEEERLRAEQAKEEEEAKLKAQKLKEEEERLKEEAERLKQEEKAQVEAERLKAEEAARLNAQKAENEKKQKIAEAERLKQEEKAKKAAAKIKEEEKKRQVKLEKENEAKDESPKTQKPKKKWFRVQEKSKIRDLQRAENTPKPNKQKEILIGSGILVVVATIVFGISSLVSNRDETLPQPVVDIRPEIVIDTTTIARVNVQNKTNLEILSEIKSSLDQGNPAGRLNEISIVKEIMDRKDIELVNINSADLLDILEVRTPGRLERSIGDVFVIGYLNEEERSNFILFEVNDFQNAFAGMLEWEGILAQDMSKLFNKLNDYLNSTPEESVINEEGEPEVRQVPIDSTFKDKVIRNMDTRVIKDDLENIKFFYVFMDNGNYLLLTDSAKTVEVIANELKNRRLVK
jgi:hypothetical protein